MSNLWFFGWPATESYSEVNISGIIAMESTLSGTSYVNKRIEGTIYNSVALLTLLSILHVLISAIEASTILTSSSNVLKDLVGTISSKIALLGIISFLAQGAIELYGIISNVTSATGTSILNITLEGYSTASIILYGFVGAIRSISGQIISKFELLTSISLLISLIGETASTALSTSSLVKNISLDGIIDNTISIYNDIYNAVALISQIISTLSVLSTLRLSLSLASEIIISSSIGGALTVVGENIVLLYGQVASTIVVLGSSVSSVFLASSIMVNTVIGSAGSVVKSMIGSISSMVQLISDISRDISLIGEIVIVTWLDGIIETIEGIIALIGSINNTVIITSSAVLSAMLSGIITSTSTLVGNIGRMLLLSGIITVKSVFEGIPYSGYVYYKIVSLISKVRRTIIKERESDI